MITGHLLSAADLTKDEALDLLATAKELAAITDGPNKNYQLCVVKQSLTYSLKTLQEHVLVLRQLLRDYQLM